MSIPNFIVWYKKEDATFRILYHHDKKFETVDNFDDINMNQFELGNHLKGNDTNLLIYCDKLIKWRNEILNSKIFKIPFDYFDNTFLNRDFSIFYRTHYNNILTFMKRFIKSDYKYYEIITKQEEEYYLKCNRGGLQYCNPGKYNCWGYDFKMFYPSIMAEQNFKFPIKQGIIQDITEIPVKFKYGVYNIAIITDDNNFKKVFNFSKQNYYTHNSLNFVLYYNKKYNANIKLEILSSKALIYNDDMLVSGFSVFNCWYNRLLDLKREFPNNKLIKSLASRCWGALCSQNIVIKTEHQINAEGITISRDFSKDYYIHETIPKDSGDVYELIKSDKQLYKLQFRFKAFITDYARIKIAKFALKDIDDIIRIQTDGIVYTKPKIFNIHNIAEEKEKTGYIEWFNVNVWKKIN